MTPHDQTSARVPSYFSPCKKYFMKKQFWKFYNIFVMKVSCCKDSWINWIVDVWQSQPIICSCLIMIHVSDTCQTRVTTHSYHFRTSIVRGATTRLQHWSLRLQWSHTKVSNFYIVLIIQQQVLWLQISMTATEWELFDRQTKKIISLPYWVTVTKV